MTPNSKDIELNDSDWKKIIEDAEKKEAENQKSESEILLLVKNCQTIEEIKQILNLLN